MKTIRWGIIATGNIAAQFAKALNYENNHSARSKLTGIASRTLEKAQSFAQKWNISRAFGSYEELIADPDIDVIYIATPNNLHSELSIAALKAGKAVLCEKPVTLTAKELLPVIETARIEKRFYMEAMWMKFNPSFQKAVEWINSGKIGTPQYIRSDFFLNVPFDPKNRLYDKELGGGALLDLGIYPVTCAHVISGKKKPENITSILKHTQTGVDAYNSSHLVWESGLSADLCSSLNLQGIKESRSAFVLGDKGAIILPYFWMAEEATLLSSSGDSIEHYQQKFECNGYEYEIREVENCLIEGKTESSIQTWADSIMVMDILDEIRTVAIHER